MRPTLYAAFACAWILAACSGGTSDLSSTAAGSATGAGNAPAAGTASAAAAATSESEAVASRIDALTKSGVPMPDAGVEAIEPAAVAQAAQVAAATAGSREPFQSIHDSITPLLPVSNLRLAAVAPPAEICVGVDANGNPLNVCPPGANPGGDGGGGAGDPAACPRVCSTACASANAVAYAAAFAHASATACAWAQAWACVYENTPPFNRVCAWARSQACATAFATAFGFGFGAASDQECRTVCSDGTVTVTNGPPPANAQPAAGKSLLRPNT
jgi:hypothetical protein